MSSVRCRYIVAFLSVLIAMVSLCPPGFSDGLNDTRYLGPALARKARQPGLPLRENQRVVDNPLRPSVGSAALMAEGRKCTPNRPVPESVARIILAPSASRGVPAQLAGHRVPSPDPQMTEGEAVVWEGLVSGGARLLKTVRSVWRGVIRRPGVQANAARNESRAAVATRLGQPGNWQTFVFAAEDDRGRTALFDPMNLVLDAHRQLLDDYSPFRPPPGRSVQAATASHVRRVPADSGL